MKPKHQIATLAALPAQLVVDEANGTIKGAAVMTIGPARGWPFSIDAVTLQQTADAINLKPKGVSVRFAHPADIQRGADGTVKVIPTESLGTDVGYLSNCRVDGDAVRGDIALAEWSSAMPGLGDVRSYLLKKAAADPTGMGLSAMFAYEPETIIDAGGNAVAVARVFDVQGVDFVARPAANPNGLLSEPEPINSPQPRTAALTNGEPMDPKAKEYMQKNHGLKADATDEEADAALAALSDEDKGKMKAACEAAPAPAATATVTIPAPATAAATAIPDEGAAIIASEKRRVAVLSELGQTLTIDKDIVALAVAEGDDVPKARVRYLAALAKKAPPVPNINNVQVGEDKKIAALSEALPQSIAMRMGVKVEKPHDMAGKLANLRIMDAAKHWLVALGAPAEQVMFLAASEVYDLLNTGRLVRKFPEVAALAQSTSSFANILVDAQNKVMRQAYQLAPATWQTWCRRGTASDFKTIYRPQLSDVPVPVSRAEGAEIKYTTVSDSKETGSLVEYAAGLRITRRALINDDTGELSRIPQKQAIACKSLENVTAYGLLTANAAMADTGALFNSTAVTTAGGHANLKAATADVGAPSVTTLSAARTAMRLQKGPKGNILNVVPKFLIVPAALESIAEQYTSAAYVAAIQTSINPFAAGGRTPLIPVVEPILDATSAAQWYLSADPSQIDTVELVFLESEPEPVLKQETDFDTDDLKLACRHTLAGMVLDFRGLLKNNGTV
jgi:hypothetical protein